MTILGLFTSGVSGYIFRYCINQACTTDYVIKIVPYQHDEEISYAQLPFDDQTRPENVDIYMEQLLEKLVYAGYTPHVGLLALAFRCDKYNPDILRMLIMPEERKKYSLLPKEEKNKRYKAYKAYTEDLIILKLGTTVSGKYAPMVAKIAQLDQEMKKLDAIMEELEGNISEEDKKIPVDKDKRDKYVTDYNSSLIKWEEMKKEIIELKKYIAPYERKMVEMNKVTYKKPEKEMESLIYFGEWAEYGTLHEYIVKNRNSEPLKIKVLMFQILYTLSVIQNVYPSWRHNDFHSSNILVQKVKVLPIHYHFKDNHYLIPGIGASIRFWDYDFANSNEVHNAKVRNATQEIKEDYGIIELPCQQYDLTTLLFYLDKVNMFGPEHEIMPFLATWSKNIAKEFTDRSGSKYPTVKNVRLAEHAQSNLDRVTTFYLDKTGQRTNITLDKLTPEFSLLNDHYFNDFRRTDMTGITAGEFYYYS